LTDASNSYIVKVGGQSTILSPICICIIYEINVSSILI
jgi:hypothetical protein